MANITYNRVIRKIIVAFGNVFNNITLLRYNENNTEQERVLVPITYAPKEQYVMRLEEDPDLDKKVQMTLPRISYEMTGLTYDSTRKQNTNIKNFFQGPAGMVSQYNPVPYNFDFALSIYTRNHEDVHQIVERILPFFTPDYTLNLNLIPEMGITKEIPLVLNSTDRQVEYEGNRDSEPRLIIWTLNFTAKGFIFGSITSAANSIIKHSITNVYSDLKSSDTIKFTLGTGSGTFIVGEWVYQGYSLNSATATAKVKTWDALNKILLLEQIDGNFISSMPMTGTLSHSSYNFTSYTPVTNKAAKIDIVVSPITANVNDQWVANTTITEY